MSSRFPLLEGVPSIQALVEDPQYAQVRAEFEAHPDHQVPDVSVRGDAAPGPHGPVPVRVYNDGAGAAHPDPARPCLVWMHGGGFMMGDLDMPEADWTARELAKRADAVVVSVDYRLCQGGVHHPVPHDDVVAAVRWARGSASSLGIDPGKVSVGGGSAGANLAAGAALRLRDDGQPPARLVFVYGVAHSVIPPLSAEHAALMREVPAVLKFPPEATSFLNLNYLGGPLSKADGYAFPALADLRGLCPVLVLNAEYDDLRSSGQAFAAALAAAGVDVRQVMVTSMLHGFLNLPASIGPVGAALELIAETLRAPAVIPV